MPSRRTGGGAGAAGSTGTGLFWGSGGSWARMGAWRLRASATVSATTTPSAIRTFILLIAECGFRIAEWKAAFGPRRSESGQSAIATCANAQVTGPHSAILRLLFGGPDPGFDGAEPLRLLLLA